MAHVSGSDRSQVLLLPEAVDDYVGPDNPVRFIDAFVDGLDLASAGFGRVAPRATGRPGYNPADLLKLYIYGYLNRVRSSRRLEAETHCNIEVIWLLRHLRPYFKTIADFRRDNATVFRAVFREADEKLADYVKRLDESDAEEHRMDSGGGRGDTKLAEKIAVIGAKPDHHKALLSELYRSGEAQTSLTDPVARAMAHITKVGVGYNIQLVVVGTADIGKPAETADPQDLTLSWISGRVSTRSA